jgi:hypothetical protein
LYGIGSLQENSNGTESNWVPTGGTRNSNNIIQYYHGLLASNIIEH